MSNEAVTDTVTDTVTDPNVLNKHCITSVAEIVPFIKNLENEMPCRGDNAKPVFKIRFSGFGSRLDLNDMIEAAKKSLKDMGVEKGDRKIFFFDGDFRSHGSFTSVIHVLWVDDRANTLIVPVRGPHAENHAKFFESWKGIPIRLLEITEDMRTVSLNMVTRFVGPESSAYDHLKIEEKAQLENTKMGWFSIFNLPLHAIISLGGGKTTANEAKMFCAYIEQHDEEVFPVQWYSHVLDRAAPYGKEGREACDPFLVPFKEDMDNRIAANRPHV